MWQIIHAKHFAIYSEVRRFALGICAYRTLLFAENHLQPLTCRLRSDYLCDKSD